MGTTIELRPDEEAALKRLAAERGETEVANLVHEAIGAYVATQQEQHATWSMNGAHVSKLVFTEAEMARVRGLVAAARADSADPVERALAALRDFDPEDAAEMERVVAEGQVSWRLS